MLNLKIYVMRTKLLLFTFLFFGIFGCQDKVEQKEEQNFESIPFVIVPKKALPEWLNENINSICSVLVGKPFPDPNFIQAEVYRGRYEGQKVYTIWTMYSNCLSCFFDEKGERVFPSSPPLYIVLNDFENNLPGSNNWELIFQIKNGVVRTK